MNMRSISSRLVLSLVLTVELAAQQSPPSENRKIKPPSSANAFVFSLLPRSFNRNALVDMTVFAEVTPAGVASPLPTPGSPLHYVAQSGGYRPGHPTRLGEKIPSETDVTTHVTKSLRQASYLPSAEGQTPDIVIIYHWGTFDDRQDDVSLMARATLIGGDKFAKELANVLGRQRENNIVNRALHAVPTTHMVQVDSRDHANFRNANSFDATSVIRGQQDVFRSMGSVSTVSFAEAFESFTPVERFKREDPNNHLLLEQSRGGLYYVVISAYDYKAVTQKQRILLWRTRLTVSDSGVSFSDTLPALLASAGPYLGKETERAGTFTKRMLRSGTVEIGPATVVEEDVQSETTPTLNRRR